MSVTLLVVVSSVAALSDLPQLASESPIATHNSALGSIRVRLLVEKRDDKWDKMALLN